VDHLLILWLGRKKNGGGKKLTGEISASHDVVYGETVLQYDAPCSLRKLDSDGGQSVEEQFGPEREGGRRGKLCNEEFNY
jgi:hypothetical protein